MKRLLDIAIQWIFDLPPRQRMTVAVICLLVGGLLLAVSSSAAAIKLAVGLLMIGGLVFLFWVFGD